MLGGHMGASAVACISSSMYQQSHVSPVVCITSRMHQQALLLAVLSIFAVVSHRTEAELSHLEHRQANSERHANKQGFGMSNVNQRNKHTNFMNAYKNVSSAPDNQKVSKLLLHSTLYILLWQVIQLLCVCQPCESATAFAKPEWLCNLLQLCVACHGYFVLWGVESCVPTSVLQLQCSYLLLCCTWRLVAASFCLFFVLVCMLELGKNDSS